MHHTTRDSDLVNFLGIVLKLNNNYQFSNGHELQELCCNGCNERPGDLKTDHLDKDGSVREKVEWAKPGTKAALEIFQFILDEGGLE